MVDRLELEARFNDLASAGVKKFGKTLEGIRPSNGMQSAQKWMGEFRTAADKANVAVRPISTGLSAVGIGGLAASLSMSELVKQFKDLADSTLTMRELGRQSGLSATAIARLQYAARKLHVDPAAVSGAISGFSSQMVEFRRHSSEFYQYLLRQNGDVARKIAADNPVDALKDTLDYLSRIPAAAQKAGASAADAAQIQKRAADLAGVGDLVPMLGKGPEELADAYAEAAQNVKLITAEMQAAADRFNDATNRFNQTWTNLENDIGPAVLDPLSHTIDKLDDALKLAAASPGDAAAGAAVIAGSFAAFWLRARIMRGSKIAGGVGMDRAAGEMAGAASQQKLATTTFAEAVAEFRLGVREMAARGAVPGGSGGPGGTPVEPGKPVIPPEKQGFFGNGGWRGLLGFAGEAGAQAWLYSEGRDLLRAGEDRLGFTQADHDRSDNISPGADLWRMFKEWRASPSASGNGARQLYSASATEEDRATRARDIGGPLRRSDDRPVTALPAHELFATVKQGSKEGIIAGLREMAQQQELGGPGSGIGEGAGDKGRGLPNMRFGRNSASGSYRRTLGQKYDLSEGGTGSHLPIADGLFKAKAPGISDRLKQDFPGMTDEDTAAVLGNLGHESAGFKAFEEGGHGPGRGWAQWTDPGRKARFFQFAQEHKLDPRSDDANYGFLKWELTHTHKNAMVALRGAQGLRAKTRAFEGAFEGAGVKAYGSRDRYADGALAAIRGAQPHGATPGAGTPAPSAAAIGDAAAFAARQRILNGGRDPKDRDLVDRYKAQQARPAAPAAAAVQAHAAGGPIRGPGGPRSDSIPAMLSNGEFVVNARASGQWLPLLHAINGHRLPRFAAGGPVGRQFYPRSTPPISPIEGKANRDSWRGFFRRPRPEGGMGAPDRVARGALAMMMGESGKGLNSNSYGWDVNGPSGGVDQLHDVTEGPGAGRLHRLSDLMTLAMQQHADWKDRSIQQAGFKREAFGPMWFAYRKMLREKTDAGALKQGINLFENPAHHAAEFARRMPNIITLQREAAAGRNTKVEHDIDPVQIDIRHHPHTGKPIVQARAGKGVKLGIRTAPMMRPT